MCSSCRRAEAGCWPKTGRCSSGYRSRRVYGAHWGRGRRPGRCGDCPARRPATGHRPVVAGRWSCWRPWRRRCRPAGPLCPAKQGAGGGPERVATGSRHGGGSFRRLERAGRGASLACGPQSTASSQTHTNRKSPNKHTWTTTQTAASQPPLLPTLLPSPLRHCQMPPTGCRLRMPRLPSGCQGRASQEGRIWCMEVVGRLLTRHSMVRRRRVAWSFGHHFPGLSQHE